MMRASSVCVAVGLLLAACAPGADEPPATDGAAPLPAAGVPETDGVAAGVDAQQAPATAQQRPDETEPTPERQPDSAAGAPRCVPAAGTTGSPRSIAELMELLDGLPKIGRAHV